MSIYVRMGGKLEEKQEEMVKLIIDNREVTVPRGTNLLEAARNAGIVIPHFCYHQALGSVGACRLCAVKILDGSQKGLKMSCMIEAADGMVVSTTDPEAVLMRKMVIEWLMTNHPHDCPVCDEGGECLLQDMTIAGGHSIRRYHGKKRTYTDQNLGPNIHQEMNRCIQCYRCSRFYQEYAGGTDFGPLGSANHVFFGRFKDGILDSPFAGNIVDICPTGVFTDKTARFQARWWDYQFAPSVCPVCSLGCNIFPIARYRELLKIQARHNEEVNGHFICDLGRFSQDMVNGPRRIHSSIIDGKEVALGVGVKRIAEKLSEIMESGVGESVGLLCSSRASFETQLLTKRLAAFLKTPWLSYFTDPLEEERTRAAVKLMNAENSISMAQVGDSDRILIVGVDLMKEAPMMALAMRQAHRKGAHVTVIGSEKPELPLTFDFVETKPDKWKDALARIYGGQGKKRTAEPSQRSGSCCMPVIICSTASCSPEMLEAVAEMARGSGQDGRSGKISIVMKGPNSFGAALSSEGGGSWEAFARALGSGGIRTLIAIEADLPDDSSIIHALEKLDLFAAADHTMQGLHRKAHLILPVTTYAEMSGTYINQEGRAQRFLKVMDPGLRIRHLEPALHPPRQFHLRAPGSDIIPSDMLLIHLLEHLEEAVGRRKEKKEPFSVEWENLKDIDPEGPGIAILK